MKDKAELTIRIEMGEEGISYSSFNTIMNNTIGILRNIAASMDADDANWLITGARMNSPLLISLVAKSKKKPRVAKRVMKNFVTGIRAIEGGGTPPLSFKDQDLENAKRIVSVLGDGVKSLTFSDADGEEVRPTQHLAANAQAIQDKMYHYEWASFRGILENILTHAGKNVFHIFDSLTDEDIQCHFNDEDTPRVGTLIKQRVLVYGRVRYDRVGRPVHIEVTEFDGILDDDVGKISEAPATNITRGVDSVEYVRKIRDGESL